jgi:DNA-binding MarR family transcriptional regulator
MADDPSPAEAMDDFVTVRLVLLAEIIARGASEAFASRFGVKNTELRILVQLGGPKPLAVNEIARRTRVDKAWISRSITALERRGLVRREPHPTDTRASLVSLTAQGRQLIEELAPVARARNDRLLEGLDRAEVHRLLDALLTRADDLLRNP